MVRVQYWAGARDAAGVEAEEQPAGALGDILQAALAAHPDLAPVLRVCSVFVDGTQVSGTGADAIAQGGAGPHVAAGSCVEILPPFAGG